MPTDSCCVQGCPSSTVLHLFPDDPERATEWCQRLDIDEVPLALVCCERHFSDGQYEGFDRTNPLKPDAVPDCNMPQIKLEAESVTSLNNNIEVAPEVAVSQSSLEFDRFKEGTFSSPPVAIVFENLDKLCRLCLETDESGTHLPLFGGTDGIVDSIQQSIGIEIDPGDPYPKQICPVCIERVNYIQRSREWFLKNDNLLKALLPEASTPTSANDDLIIPDVVPTTSAATPTEEIFFKEEAGGEYNDDRFLLLPRRNPVPASKSHHAKARKKRLIANRPTSFCTMCSREFECPRDLRNHLYSAHQGVICKHCGVAYSHPGTLQMHIKQHHGEKERLAEWKEQAAQNLFREMAETFNGGVVQVQGGGEGASAAGCGEAGADSADWKAVARGRPKRLKHK